MAEHKGECHNFGLCNTADRKVGITVTKGEFVCPECGQPLHFADSRRGRGFWRIASVVLAFGAIAAAAHWIIPASGVRRSVQAAMDQGNVILTLSGANRIGSALAPALAEEFLKQRGAQDVKTVPGAKEAEVRVQGLLPGQLSPKIIEIRSHGSNSAFEDLGNGAADIGMASRSIKSKEVVNLAKFGLGDMTSVGAEHIVGLDGIAVIVNRKNPVEEVSKKNLSLVFTGEIRDWAQLGGLPGAINIYVRDESSGTYDTFKSLVLGDQPLVESAHRLSDNRALSDDVAKDPNGIGVVSLENVRGAKALAIAEKGARPLLPNQLNVATEDYPLTRRLTLYTPVNPRNELTRQFVAFALSTRGQRIVERLGFVSQNVSAASVSIPAGAPEQYRKLTSGADRLTLDFRFRSGTSELDAKAAADLDRVVTFLSDLHYSGNNILLFGFADNTGTKEVNDVLSKKRADAVAQEFDQRGIKPAVVTGFGSQLPVGSNDSAEGREKNRRVEIWLKKQA